MPTGYTAYIEDGDITTAKDFLLLCTRAMGVAISLREEPLSVPTPLEFKPDTAYYDERLSEALRDKEYWTQLSSSELHDIIQKKQAEKLERAKLRYQKEKELYDRYEKILIDIMKWNPPVDCEHLKEFAIDQITISKPELNDRKEQIYKAEKPIEDEEAYRKYMIDHAIWEINYQKEQIELEIKNAQSRTDWMKALMESLKQFDEKE